MKGYKHKRTLSQPDEFREIKKYRLEEIGIIDPSENEGYKWFKEEIQKQVRIHNLINSLRFFKDNREELIRICNKILRIDPYNEIALKIKEQYK